MSDLKRTIQITVFDSFDGVRSHAFASGYTPHVTKSPDGKLWFLARDGVSVIDPRHIPFNNLPPPVHVEQFTADRKTYRRSLRRMGLRLPPLIRDLEIDYTALSFVAPEKNSLSLHSWKGLIAIGRTPAIAARRSTPIYHHALTAFV